MDKDPRSQALESADPGAASLDGDLEESRQLFEAAAREWRAVAESLYDLKKALEPGDFAAALAHLKVPGLEGLVRDWRQAQAGYEAALSSAPGRRGAERAPRSTQRARVRRRTPGSRRARERAEATAENATPAAPEPRPVAAEPAPDGADRTMEIQQQLKELTTLLRQHVALASDQDQTSRVEIPRQLTLSIAREVAGRVKDSVLETLRANREVIDSTADPRSEKRSDRVPLEDVAAMIDQLTRF